MKARLISIDDPKGEREKIREAADIIRGGGTVIFPTETVYGLGADGLNPTAAQKIYQAKGRPSDNPLILHISDMGMLFDLVQAMSKKAELLAKHFWPGPLTMIFEKSDSVPLQTTGGLNSVAVRMPSNEVARELIRLSNTAVAAPSANLSGKPSITEWESAVEEMGERVDAILISEPSEVGLESTIVDMTCEPPMILRLGKITPSQIESVIGTVETDRSILGEKDRPKAPGMKYRHYSPEAEVIVVKGDKRRERIAEECARNRSENPVVFSMGDGIEEYKGLSVYNLGKDSLSAAKNLFFYLRKADKEGHKIVYIEQVGEDELARAVMNRAEKAAGGRVIDLTLRKTEGEV